jgi:hypothetical protein
LDLKEHIAITVCEAFRNWASREEKWRKTYNKLTPDGLGIFDQFVHEVAYITPSNFYNWHVHHHMRFKNVPQRQKQLIIQLATTFLTLYEKGKLLDGTSSSKKKSKKRKTPVGQGSETTSAGL